MPHKRNGTHTPSVEFRTQIEGRARVQEREQNADKHELVRKVKHFEERAAHGFDRRRKHGRKRTQRNDAVHIAVAFGVRNGAEQHGRRKAQNHDDGVHDLTSARTRNAEERKQTQI